MKKKVISTNISYNYFFVKPSCDENVYISARKLSEIDGVREVVIVEGEYGFIVKADSTGKRNYGLPKEILKIVGGGSKMAVSHYKYLVKSLK